MCPGAPERRLLGGSLHPRIHQPVADAAVLIVEGANPNDIRQRQPLLGAKIVVAALQHRIDVFGGATL